MSAAVLDAPAFQPPAGAPPEGDRYLWKAPAWSITDPQEHIVEGYASLPNLDDQGDVVPVKALEAALPEYMKWGNLREMHGKNAAGKVLEARADDHGIWIKARIDDEQAWNKVRAGVYQGFSIGGEIEESTQRGKVRIINALKLNEISLVDRPANSQATIQTAKGNFDAFVPLTKMLVMKGDAVVEKPALSEAQRRYLNARFGHDWVKEHHFDNRGHLPGHVHKWNGENKCEECGCDRTPGHPGTGSSSGMAERPDAAKAADNSEQRSTQGKREYGNVTYADPKHNKYPVDTPGHVRAAWSYINMPKNQSGYSAEELSSIKSKIRAAARRHGINISEKAIGMINELTELRDTLADSDSIAVIDKAIAIAKAGGAPEEWHTQRDIGNRPQGEAHTGVEDEQPAELREDFMTPEGSTPLGSADSDTVEHASKQPDDEEACKEAAQNDQAGMEDSAEKASGPMGHLQACHKSLLACHKALGDNHPAKPHAASALSHLGKAMGSFKAAAASANFTKSYEAGYSQERIDEIERQMERLAQRTANELTEVYKVLAKMPQPRHVPTTDHERDLEGSTAVQEVLQARRNYGRRY